MKIDENEILVNQVFRQVRDQLNSPQMTMLNKRLVQFINMQSKLQRAAVGAKISDAEYVKFVSRKHSRTILLKVEKVTPAGVVYGTTVDGTHWKVSATVCAEVDRAQFEGAVMAASARL